MPEQGVCNFCRAIGPLHCGFGDKKHYCDDQCFRLGTEATQKPDPLGSAANNSFSPGAAGCVPVIPKRDAVIVEIIVDQFVISIECFDSTNEEALQKMAKDILNIGT